MTEILKTGKDLDDLLGSYTLDDAAGRRCLQITADLMEDVRAYTTLGGAYGAEILHPHLMTISQDGADFLGTLGFSAQAQSNFNHAYRLSDIGKMHPCYGETDWLASKGTGINDGIKQFRRDHTVRGVDLLRSALAGEDQAVRDHPHWDVVRPLMVFHHEHMDGRGTHRLAGEDMGKVLQVACVVDALDGDIRQRPHQTRARTPAEALERMKGDQGTKYEGVFDPDLLGAYSAFKLAPSQNLERRLAAFTL